jgi:tetratricopeptide (TPR) repeat protein
MKRSVIIVMLFPFLAAFANTPEELLNDANEAYKRSEYVYAIEKYEQILKQDLVSADLYYNLGNAYFKSNQIGPAILNYERALQLKPLDEDIRHNLTVARSRTIDRIDERPMLFYERWFMASWSLQSLDGWGITIIILLVLFLSTTSVYLFSRTISLKKTSFYIMILFFLLLGLSALSARKQYNRLNTEKEAIVMHPRVSAKSSPSPQSPDLFLLHEGTRVNIRTTLGQWYEITLPNGNVGWIKEETLEII